MSTVIFSIGHSTHTWDGFVDLLRAHHVEQLADVRRFPGSRRQPQFAPPALERALLEVGIAYRWFPELGGRRKRVPGAFANTAWQVEAFRGYADHMASNEFRLGLDALETWARAASTTSMCAEALYVKCHRRLLSDALFIRGWQVLHITSKTRAAPHTLTAFACITTSGGVTYPGQPQLGLLEHPET